jgi:catechol 2,3-dioxygenase-like lactoylglutathione lyase family enzyme
MFTDTPTFSSFAVPDVDQARAFSGDTLGIRITKNDDMGGVLTLHLAEGRDTFVYPKPDFTPATYTILNFRVEDIDAAADALNAKGIEFERYEGFGQDERGIARGDAGPPIAWFTDPFGNVLSVIQA